MTARRINCQQLIKLSPYHLVVEKYILSEEEEKAHGGSTPVLLRNFSSGLYTLAERSKACEEGKRKEKDDARKERKGKISSSY